MNVHHVGPNPRPLARSLRVLLIEDDFSSTPVWSHLLNSLAVANTLTHISSIEEAELHIASKGPYDLIITKMFLGESSDGLKLWEKLKSRNQVPEFIIISSFPTSGYDDLIEKTDSLSFVRSPINPTLCKQILNQKVFAILKKEMTKENTKRKEGKHYE